MLLAKGNSGGGGNRQLPEKGVHNAVCSKVFDLGMHPNTFDTSKSDQQKCMLVFELEALIEDEASEYFGKRLLQHAELTVSLNEKATLKRFLESWRKKEFTQQEIDEGFDIHKLVGVQCTLNIIHKTAKTSGKERAEVDAIMPALKNAPMMNPELPKNWCPDWIKTKISAGDGAEGDVSTPTTFEDDVPF